MAATQIAGLTTHCPTCGTATDYGTAPHVAFRECGLCARWRVAQERRAYWCCLAYWCTLAGLVVSLIAAVVMGEGR